MLFSMKAIKLFVFVTVLLCAIFSFSSCSRLMGYSVVLWSLPEQNLTDGMIVPVYIKSNITHTYVIGIPETDQKCEVPLWQISEPASKKDVKELAEKYIDYQRKYAKVKLDGLPIRYEPVNTARQVYRLREGEVLKVLYKGQGSAVMSGKTALEGDWLRVLTNDGTAGWCFSYNLNVFDEREEQNDSSNDSQTFVIDEYLKKTVAQAYENGYVSTISGRRREIAELQGQNKMLRAFGERVAKNSPIQGSAADIIKIAMVKVDKALREEGIDARIILQVHDELVLESHVSCLDKAKEILTREMESAVSLSVPLPVDVTVGRNWYEN